ncbi:hypothetical protein F5141DRAFT_1065808 [Pisolithus sp. B1]|nr:hypothetical protein F5141DRAFT_1065808 [Pisolithus sp. B1]
MDNLKGEILLCEERVRGIGGLGTVVYEGVGHHHARWNWNKVQSPSHPTTSDMPKAKANCGSLKMISCPHCGKSADSNTYQDWDLNALSPGVPEAEDFVMDIPEEVMPLVPSKFVEVYEGSSEVFPGGKSFMDTFHKDQYSSERRNNLYFPFALQQEWQFASWLLCSRLSLIAIDSLLALDILQGIPLSFCTGKQLHAHAEVLPSGPAWLCKELEPKSPTKHPVCLFYHQPLKCLQSLLSHPLLAPHISFILQKVWMSAARDALPCGATVLGVVLSSDKMNISVMTGNRMAHPVLISLANIDTNTPEECLLATTSPKVSPITTATSKDFGDPFHHPPHTSSITLSAIQCTCAEQDPFNYKNFIKVIRALHLNGVIEPIWKGWPLSEPPDFITPEPLHHFHRFSWDHDTRWCILATGVAKFDYQFSLLQTLVRYCAFEDGMSKLKQVTGCDHHAVQHYIDFHDNKDTIMGAETQKDSWEIPKLELLQSVIPSIHLSGAVMQWSADPTEHVHVQEIKVLARAGNNQDYYNQITCHLDCTEKCLHFNIATYMESKLDKEDLPRQRLAAMRSRSTSTLSLNREIWTIAMLEQLLLMSETWHAIPLGMKLLTSHMTPHSLSHLQTMPPMHRRKLNWYHEKMDALVNNDTQDLHWPLSSSESRKWHADGATAPLKGSDANRKPDLILLPLSIVDSFGELDWRDVIVFREMKSRKTTNMLRKQIIVKDSWIDPLWKFMEGSMLAKLNDANVEVHKDAIVKAKVLHHDISLLNLLLVLWDTSWDDSCHLDFLDHLMPETHKHLQAKIQEIPYRGFFVDWGYAILIDVPQAEAYTTPEPEGPSTSPSTPHHDALPTSPISPPNTLTSVDNLVPIRIPVPSEGTDWIAYIALLELKDVHKIMLSMGRDPLPDWSQPSVDTNPLYCTGMWSRMATELVMAGTAKPIVHMAGHDLESLFYVLLGICVLFDEPYQPKPEAKLAECFNVYFNTFELSLLKMTTIQSKIGWSYNIIQYISPYFQPLVPLLNILQERIVLPMDFIDNSFRSNNPITHDEMSQALLQALCSLDNKFWVPHTSPAHSKEPANCNSDHEVRSGSLSDASGSIASEPDGSLELLDAQFYFKYQLKQHLLQATFQ